MLKFQKYKELLFFKVIYWVARVGLALTFITSGIRKLPGIKFTSLPIDNPVGAYFQAMYDTGMYWNIIGYIQIVIGFMLLINRVTVLATVLMTPITINIFLISISLHMRGTPIITALMLLGNVFLLFWYYNNYKGVLSRPK